MMVFGFATGLALLLGLSGCCFNGDGVNHVALRETIFQQDFVWSSSQHPAFIRREKWEVILRISAVVYLVVLDEFQAASFPTCMRVRFAEGAVVFV